ncbi:alpha/beta hydrolase [Nodosilinea sp. P-1105]|uniref:alpha/beta fold hydrolase n=1 Tax=Nodosilinea sp. P-1105 TaxID=2546229 RepID=UPI00146D5EEE|nr:alpha/beta hydrolase [Nodosilinea sp. P-1105]NMF86287.1 alpha/beta hydrolase [Nodosilinea sp. P-1105]
MANPPDTLWLCLNPSLRPFDQLLCRQLNRQTELRCWGYYQTPDEPCCIETALGLLHQYMRLQGRPMHLLGHGLSGALGLLYARLHPHWVTSLTLLSVGGNPAVGWHAHYYALRDLLPCDRKAILMQMARMLFGPQVLGQTLAQAKLLAQVLDTELTPHSIGHHNQFSPGGVIPPLLVCRGEHDTIVDPNAQAQWQPWLKPGDSLWSCPEGRHFFHYDHPQPVSQIILEFWQGVSSASSDRPLIELKP